MHVLDLDDEVVGRLLGLKGDAAEEVAEFCPNEPEEPEVLSAIRIRAALSFHHMVNYCGTTVTHSTQVITLQHVQNLND